MIAGMLIVACVGIGYVAVVVTLIWIGVLNLIAAANRK